jgi:drug/metabolite transporter (DMT)-like permease
MRRRPGVKAAPIFADAPERLRKVDYLMPALVLGSRRLRTLASLAPLACLLVVGALLGLTANMVKVAVASGWPPLAFLFWATLGAGLILLGRAAASGAAPGAAPRDLKYYLATGLLSIALPNALVFAAVPHVGASFVATCFALPPLLTYGLVLALGMERPRALRALGVLFGLAGAALLGLAKARGAAVDPLWVVAALTGPVFIACGNIYRTLRWPPGATALSLAPGMMLGGAALILPYLLASGTSLLPSPPSPRDAATLWILLAQTIVLAATYALYFVLQKLAGPVYLSQIGSVGAVFGAALAVFALGEPAGLALPVAGGAILLGVFLVNRGR